MIASSLFRPQNRATTRTALGPLDQIDSMWSKGDVKSGVAVNQSTALTLPAFLQGVRKIAQDVGLLEFHVYERLEKGGKRRAPDSPWWRVVHDRANPWQSSQQFRECMTGIAILRGSALALPTVVRGNVVELLPLLPGSWRIEQHDDGSLTYWVTTDGGREKPYTRDDVFHLAGFGLDGLNGLGLLNVGREVIGEGLAQSQESAARFANGSRHGGYLKAAGPLTKDQAKALKEEWEELHRGLDNAHRIAVLPNDLSWQDVGMTAEAAQAIESRQFTVVEFARLIDIPPHKLFEMGRATWGNVELMQIEYFLGLQPWVKRWENETNQRVIRTDTHFAEMLPETILRLDTKTQTEVLVARTTNGIMTRNEARRAINLEPIAGLDAPLTPANLVVMGDEPPAEETQPARPTPLAALAAKLALLGQPEPAALPAPEPGTFTDPRIEQSFCAAVLVLSDRGGAAHQITVTSVAAEMGYARTSLHDLMKADRVDFAAKVAAVLATE